MKKVIFLLCVFLLSHMAFATNPPVGSGTTPNFTSWQAQGGSEPTFTMTATATSGSAAVNETVIVTGSSSTVMGTLTRQDTNNVAPPSDLTFDYSPENATISWTASGCGANPDSGSESTASVSTASFQCTEAGTVTVTFTVVDNTGYEGCFAIQSGATTTVTIGNPPPALSLSGPSTLEVGGSATFTAGGGTPPYTFSASNSYATIVPTTGALTGVAAGDVTISVNDAIGSGTSALLTVTAAPPATVRAVDAEPTTIGFGEVSTISAMPDPENGILDHLHWRIYTDGADKGLDTVLEGISGSNPRLLGGSAAPGLYVFKAWNGDDESVAVSSVGVTVNSPPPPDVASITYDNALISYNDNVDYGTVVARGSLTNITFTANPETFAQSLSLDQLTWSLFLDGNDVTSDEQYAPYIPAGPSSAGPTVNTLTLPYTLSLGSYYTKCFNGPNGTPATSGSAQIIPSAVGATVTGTHTNPAVIIAEDDTIGISPTMSPSGSTADYLHWVVYGMYDNVAVWVASDDSLPVWANYSDGQLTLNSDMTDALGAGRYYLKIWNGFNEDDRYNDSNTFTSVNSEYIYLLPIPLSDIKDHANTGDDVVISNWSSGQQIADANIAWIEAHSSATDATPRMPQLVFSVQGLPQNVTLAAKLLVEYERPYAGKQPEDTVRVPANGSFQDITNGKWDIWSDYSTLPFFGGDATLTYKINGGAEQTIKFAIGGRNPDDDKCKAYTQGRPGAPWYAYAIEKHESQAYNAGFYNQFWERSGNSSPINGGVNYTFTKGDPLVVRSPGETGVGGTGLAQVTGAGGNKTSPASRQVYWNWQQNIDEFMSILAGKIQIAETFMNDTSPRSSTNPMPTGQRPQTVYHTGSNVPVPSRVQGQVTFGDVQGQKRPEEAVAIKAYNGASSHWCSWRGPTVHEWQFNYGQNNYVERVGNQVEEGQ